MPSVRLSGPNNSTMFTTCCSSAINDYQSLCPRCGEPVYPYPTKDDLSDYQVHMARWERAYGPYRAADRRRNTR